MIGPASRRWLRRGVVAVVASTGLLFSWAFERSSLERGNRLHRSGEFTEATVIYQERVSSAEDAARVSYNLGTALLKLGSSSARAALEEGEQSGVVDVQARAHYNSGLLSLTRAIEEGDSVRAHAAAAVDANRAALRLRPDHRNTKWNLAMAQRLLDSIDAADRRSGRETAEGAVEVDEVVRSENVADVEAEDELPQDAPQEGEEEALADDEDELALTAAEAAEILGQTHLDGTLMVQKLIALESRGFWGRRIRSGGPRR